MAETKGEKSLSLDAKSRGNQTGAKMLPARDCAWCKKKEDPRPGMPIHRPCSGCKMAYYCSVRCQQKDWKRGGHKQRCVPIKGATKVTPKKADDNAAEKASSIGVDPLPMVLQNSQSGDQSSRVCVTTLACPESSIPTGSCNTSAVASISVENEEYYEDAVDAVQDNPPPDQKRSVVNEEVSLAADTLQRIGNDAFEFGVAERGIISEFEDSRGGQSQVKQDVSAQKDAYAVEVSECQVNEVANIGESCHLRCVREMKILQILNICPTCCKTPLPETEQLYDSAARSFHRLKRTCLLFRGESREMTAEQESSMRSIILKLQHASDHGFVKASRLLGNIYTHGYGVTENEESAHIYFNLALKQLSTQCDKSDNAKWLESLESSYKLMCIEKAAILGDATAQFDIANNILERDVQDIDCAIEWYQKAADQKLAAAQVKLGTIYYYGTGGRAVNKSKAAELFQEAALQDHPYAAFHLGSQYQCGEGVSQNYCLAAKFLKIAAKHYTEARCNIGELYLEGLGVPVDKMKALDWFNSARLASTENIENVDKKVWRLMQIHREEKEKAAGEVKLPSIDLTSQPSTRVELYGIKSKPELNGKLGYFQGYTKPCGRCYVKVDGESSYYFLKPSNFRNFDADSALVID